MGHIFISYSRRDSQFVDTLRSRLESSGIPVWVDRADIQGGSKWRSEIVKAIEEADAFVIVLSRHSIQSDNVRKELDVAEGFKARVIPLELEPVPIPPDFQYQLAGLQRIEFSRDFETGLAQLLDALRKSPRPTHEVRHQAPPIPRSESYQPVVSKYAQSIKDRRIYFLSAIPEKMLKNAYKTFARNALALNEIPLCFMDRNALGGKYGVLVTNQTLYWRDSITNAGERMALKDIFTIEPIPRSVLFPLGDVGLRVNNKTNIYNKATNKNLGLISNMILELARLQD